MLSISISICTICFIILICHATDKILVSQVAVVTVAFPATPLLLARARICISASHTREDLMKALDVSCFSNLLHFIPRT
jgi:hypothetical protein